MSVFNQSLASVFGSPSVTETSSTVCTIKESPNEFLQEDTKEFKETLDSHHAIRKWFFFFCKFLATESYKFLGEPETTASIIFLYEGTQPFKAYFPHICEVLLGSTSEYKWCYKNYKAS